MKVPRLSSTASEDLSRRRGCDIGACLLETGWLQRTGPLKLWNTLRCPKFPYSRVVVGERYHRLSLAVARLSCAGMIWTGRDELVQAVDT